MIEVARANAEEVGLGDSITFKQLALKDFTTEKEYGVMVANPPYGERLGEEKVFVVCIKKWYVFRPLTTWNKYILTVILLLKNIMVPKLLKRKLYNGALRTDLFQYWGTRPPRKPRED